MRRMRNLFSMILLLVCLLVTVSAWAMPPEDGIYEKKDGSGNVTARMFIITLRGKASETQEGFTMETSPGAPIIAMQALDGNGNVTEELATCYSWKTDTAGAGETGIRLRGETLQNAMQKYKKFTPEVFSTAFGQQVEFGFVNEGRANAYNCSDALNGEYVRNSSATHYYPISVLLFVYEKTLNSQAFLNRGIPANTYSLSDEQEAGPWHGDYYVLNVSNQDRQGMWTVTAEKNLRIVMEHHDRDYHFLFVRDNYHGDPSFVGITWSAFTGEAMTSVNALYLHRHMTLFAPEMLENPDTFIRLTDFYSGEGPDAVTTNAMAVLVPEGNDTMRLGHANVSDRGNIQLFKEPKSKARVCGSVNSPIPIARSWAKRIRVIR